MQLEGPSKDREQRYRQFVETGLATDDEEFAAVLWRSALCIGGVDFREEVEARYRTLVSKRRVAEDVSFRQVRTAMAADTILAVVAATAGIDPKDLGMRQPDCRWRAVAARMLCRYGGVTQRAAASMLGVRTGVAVSCQLRKLTQLLQSDAALRRAMEQIEKCLDRKQRRQTC